MLLSKDTRPSPPGRASWTGHMAGFSSEPGTKQPDMLSFTRALTRAPAVVTGHVDLSRALAA